MLSILLDFETKVEMAKFDNIAVSRAQCTVNWAKRTANYAKRTVNWAKYTVNWAN